MIKKILPLLFLIVGAGAGVGAGLFLRPDPPPAEAAVLLEGGQGDVPNDGVEHTGDDAKEGEEDSGVDFVKMNNQFVVPIVRDKNVVALVVMSLSLEVAAGQKDQVFQREPKLRDSFLQVLFDHANLGGFEGAFTEAGNLGGLRTALREVAQKDMGKEVVRDVLILEIARQDY